MKILGIETSCDETAVAIYDGQRGLLAHQLFSQIDLHAQFGGIVPELASRDHVQRLLPLVKAVIQQAGLTAADIQGVAYTAGPGLVGALMVGAMLARSLAFAWGVPDMAVHHLEGHLLAPMLEAEKPVFPFLALLVSGGHTQLIVVKNIGQYQLLGESMDDAAGEAFDKVAKLLGLNYPGGPLLAQLAERGQADSFRFPRPMTDRPGLNFSFSGLKTACALAITAEPLTETKKANLAASFQQAMVDTLIIKSERALTATGLKSLVVAGGVSANRLLRQQLQSLARQKNLQLYFPRLEFCTDNAAMIAYAGHERLVRGYKPKADLQVRARWPLADIEEGYFL